MELLRDEKMKARDFTAIVSVEETAENVFDAINDIRAWWSEDVEGSTHELNHEFIYRDKHLWCKMKTTEIVRGEKVVWHVLESQMDNFKSGTEWNGTKLIFEIRKSDDKTEIHFTHFGLVPDFECYAVCSKAWSFYIRSSLHRLITTGKGDPIKKNNCHEPVLLQVQ